MLGRMIMMLVQVAIEKGIRLEEIKMRLDEEYRKEWDRFNEEARMPAGLTVSQQENWRHMQRVRRACGADEA